MSTSRSTESVLIEKIRALPPEKLAEVEDFVELLLQKGPLTLADIDPEDPQQMARFSAQRLREAGLLLEREMKSLKELGIVDESGELIDKELPPDMREDSSCDV